MSTARYEHTATLLADGTVLVVGGLSSSPLHPVATAERYDPAHETWSPTQSLRVARSGHTATRLADGTVLVAGGYNSDFDAISSAELYDPATGTWSPAANMAIARTNHAATLLADGGVLVSGGFDNIPSDMSQAETERYDPATHTWSSVGSLVTGRAWHSSVLLADGTVLVVGGLGGLNAATPLATAEVYDPPTGTWSPAASTAMARALSTATLLSDGTVLATGGYNLVDGLLATAERYRPTVVPPGSGQ